jgi:L-ribulose-5-phosphate 4-epimerase
MADEFGGEIPIAPFALIGDAGIGELVVDTLTGHKSAAVLLKNHGVFTIGPTPKDAVKAAVMCEDAARTVAIAEGLGKPDLIPADDVAALHARYKNVYGQR